MFSMNGNMLVSALAVVLVLLGHQFTEAASSHSRSVVDELNRLRDYLNDLKFLEEEEKRQGLSDIDKGTVGQKTILKTCDQCVKEPIKIDDDKEFQKIVIADLKNWDDCYREWMSKSAIAEWNFETDMTEENENLLTNVTVEMSDWLELLARNAKRYLEYERKDALSDDVERKLRLMAFVTTPKNKNDAEELIEVQSRLQNTYSKATVHGGQLEPDLTNIMSNTSLNESLLLDVWRGWRDATGPNMRQDYSTLVRLLNQGATDNGFEDYAEAWIASQFDETDDLEEMAEELWQEILPLYEQLHAYMRTKLAKIYPQYDDIFEQGGIPAHISGNMWAQDWSNIYELVKPYPDVVEPNIDEEMKKQGYTVNSTFKMSEHFYQSIGLYKMSQEFESRSMKIRPDNKDVVCHAAAFDFYSVKPEKDFRIKMCTEVNMNYLETIHHEMGHIEYFMAYQDQPAIYRAGANSAFHEAVGDTISLSVMSRKHLKTIKLLDADDDEEKLQNYPIYRAIKKIEGDMDEINFLMKRALFKIGFIPFGYMIDKWRWDVFRGKITEENYNKRWWELRLQYQGIISPVTRSEADFDPGAKFHIPSNSPYICYFISFIVQFQFYEAMCDASGHTGELHDCDFYNSKEAGKKLLDMLKLGMSKPWPEAMEKLTGNRKISTKSIMKYFGKLHDWLKQENRKHRAQIGWKDARINWKT